MDNNPIKYSDLVTPDNSIENLIKQLNELTDTYQFSMNTIKKEAVNLSASMKNVSGATEEGRSAIRDAAKETDKLAQANKAYKYAISGNNAILQQYRESTQEINRIKRLEAKLIKAEEGSYNKLSAQYSLNKIRRNGMSEAQRQAAERTEGLITKTRELYQRMNEMQKETGKYTLQVGNYAIAAESMEQKLMSSLGINQQFGQSIIQLGKGSQAVTGAFNAIGGSVKALGATLMGLLANPVFLAIAGIAGAGMAFKWWYDYNEGLREATKMTAEFTGKSGDDLKAYRNEISGIADTFNQEFKPTLQAADALAAQFGISFDEAAKIIKDGFVAGADLNGDFLSKVQQYAPAFKQAGMSAQEYVAILTQTRSGIFGDKGLEAIKQADARIRQMSANAAKSLEAIGLPAEQLQKDLTSGAKSTFDVIREISAKLSELPDNSREVGEVLINVFGKQGRDAGLEMIRSLKDISTNLDEVKSQTGLLGRLQEEQADSQIELQNALSALFDQTGGNFETLTAKAKLFVTNGITRIIKGIISVINYVVDLYNKSQGFRQLWQGIIVNLKNGFDFLANVFKMFGQIISGYAKALKGLFTLDFKGIAQGLGDVLTAVPKLLKNQWKDIKKNIKEGVDNVNKTVKPITIPVKTSGKNTNTRSKPVTGDYVPEDTSGGKSEKSGKSGKSGKRTDARKTIEQQQKDIEQAYKKALDARRKLEDAQLALEKDMWEKRRKQTIYQYSRQVEDLQHQLVVDKELNEDGRKTINDTIKALEQQQTEALLAIERERQLKELQLQKETIALRLKAVAEGSEQERELKLQQLELDKQITLLQNAQKPVGERQSEADIKASYNRDIAAIADNYMRMQLQLFDQQQEFAQSEFDLLRNSEERKTRFRLQQEKARLQKILELNKLAGTKLSDVEIATINNTIKKIDQEITQSGIKERTQDIYGLFGLNLDDEQKEAIDESVQYAQEAIRTLMDSYVQAAEAKVQLANADVERAKSVLDAEIEARNNGYANNVAMAQKEFELAKKNQQKALREQEKAKKQQLVIDAATQASSLITATANIWKQFSNPWIAIPIIALMWGSFAASKIKAMQMTRNNQTEQYGDGTVEMLQGGSHQSGNDIDLGTKPDGTRRRAEGGEFFAVINKRNSRRYRRYIPNLINSLNRGTFEKNYLNRYKGDEAVNVSVSSSNPELRKLAADVKEIKEQNARRVYTDGRGNTYEVYKNLTRRTKQ